MAITIKNLDSRKIISFLVLWTGINLILANRFLFENILKEFSSGLLQKIGTGLFFLGAYLLFKNWTSKNKDLNVFAAFKTVLMPLAICIMVLIPFYVNLLDIGVISEFWLPLYYFISSFTTVVYLSFLYFIYRNLIENEDSNYTSWKIRTLDYLLLFGLLFLFIPQSYESSLYFPFLSIGVIAILFFATRVSWIGRIFPQHKWRLAGLLAVINFVNVAIFIQYSLHFDYYFFETSHYPFPPFFLLLLFISITSFTALLSLLFYIPISRTIERKSIEIDRLIKIGNLGRKKSKDIELYQFLLKAAVDDTNSVCGWFNFKNETESQIQAKNISIADIEKVESRLYHRLEPSLWKQKYFEISYDTHPFIFDKELMGFHNLMSFNYNIDFKEVGRLYLVKNKQNQFSTDHIHIVRSYLKQARLSYQSRLLVDKQVEAKRVEEEFKQARTIQQKLLPKYNIMDDAIDVDAFLHPCLELGGDFYDLYKLDENRILFILGDVAGKGLSASLYMAELKGIFQTLSTFDLEPKDFIYKINEIVNSCFERKVFVTLTYLLINKEDKSFTYSRAGQSPLLYYSAKNKEAKYFEDEGMGLGILTNSKYEEKIKVYKHHYESGDIILLFSDGISEATNEKNKMFGLSGIKKAVEKAPKSSALEINKYISSKITKHTLKNPHQDDLTSLVIKIK